MELENLKKILSPKKLYEAVPDLIEKKSKWFVFFLFFAMAAYAIFIWHRYIFDPRWDDAKRQEYIMKQDKGVTFNKTKFERVVADGKNREAESSKKTPDLNDIFRLKK